MAKIWSKLLLCDRCKVGIAISFCCPEHGQVLCRICLGKEENGDSQ